MPAARSNHDSLLDAVEKIVRGNLDPRFTACLRDLLKPPAAASRAAATPPANRFLSRSARIAKLEQGLLEQVAGGSK